MAHNSEINAISVRLYPDKNRKASGCSLTNKVTHKQNTMDERDYKSMNKQENGNDLIADVSGMLRLIDALRQTDKYIEMIYMNGACYQFHLFLKTFFPESKPYISKEKDHIITKYASKYYDITGEVSGNWYTPMTESEIDMASAWSFHRTKVIQIGECSHCEEPIVV